MARDPGSLWSPLPESGHQGSHVKDKFIVHSTGDRGTAAAVFNYFGRAAVVVESTFIIGRGPEDPTRQILDSAEVADANLAANGPGIAVEVVGTEFDPFTDWQVSELIRLGGWAHANHPIPFQVVPSPAGAGYGWHVMFGSPGPWTPVAKACPGAARIAQLKATVFPAIFAGMIPGRDWFDMASKEELLSILRTEGISGAGDPGHMLSAGYQAALDTAVTKLAAVQTSGGVDIDALADLVVDRISARLA